MKDWRTYERHSISAEYPDIKGKAWDDFVENMTKRKVRKRTITLFEGKILDGWQLQRACLLLGFQPKYEPLPDGEDPRSYVREANECRRHESAEAMQLHRDQRIAREAQARRDGKTMREIAEQEGVSQMQVSRDLAEAVLTGVTTEPETGTITGQDGKSYTPRARTKRPNRKPKTGSILFDFKELNPPLGVLMRLIDKFGNAYHCKETPAAEGLRRLLGQFKADFKKLAEFKMKQNLSD